MHRKEGICSWYWLNKVDMICFITATPYHQMRFYDLDQPASGKKRDWQVKTLGTGNNPNCKAGKRSRFPLLTREISGEDKFGDHILPIPPSQCTQVYKQTIHYSQEKCQGKDSDYYFRSSSTVLLGKICDWCPLWHHKYFVVFVGFLHMYTLNSCHFFLYLLWIFKKCYQSTCFTIFFFFLFFPFYSRSQRSLGAHPKAH